MRDVVRGIRLRVAGGLILAGILAIAGCGLTTSSAIGRNGTSSAGERTVQQSQPSQPSPSPTLSASGVSQNPATQGQVTVTMNKAHYTTTDSITATIFNGLATSISSADHQTQCTVLTVEMLQNNQWVPVAPCRSMIATRIVPFAAGSQTPVSLVRVGGAAQGSFPPGTYRAKFTYMSGQSGRPGPAATVYSGPFTIG